MHLVGQHLGLLARLVLGLLLLQLDVPQRVDGHEATMKAPMNTANLKRIPRLNDMAIPPEARIDGGPPCPSPGTRDRATLVIIRQTRARAAESRG